MPKEPISRSIQPQPQPQPPPHSSSSPPLSLNDAATLIINQLPPSFRDFAFEVADVILKIPRWQLVAGILLFSAESGNLVSPSLDPSWTTNGISLSISTCPECGKQFTPHRLGQIFCSNECGLSHLSRPQPSAQGA